MVAKKKTQRFDILISPAWRPMLRVLGVKPENAYAELTGDEMYVRFGRLSHTFSLDAIETASIDDWPLWAGIGPRYVPGTVAFVGTFINTVVVKFSGPQTVRAVLPIRCNRLFLSLKEPEKFIAAVT
ncbi:MAG: hypothetical protein ACE5FA_09955, partial [Dehalococcoidia bacterium]